MFRLLYRFMTKISFTVVSELLLELVMLAFMMLFFMSFARISSQICQKGEMKKAMRYGLVAAMICAVLGLTRLIVTVGGKTELLPSGFNFSLADLTFAVFAVIYINACTKTGRPSSEDEFLPDEYEEEEKTAKIDDDFLAD